jgi:hypothetical protein
LTKGLVGAVRSHSISMKRAPEHGYAIYPWTHVTKARSTVRDSRLHPGQYVSIRFWMQGDQPVADDIHIYAQPPRPKASGMVKGVILKTSTKAIRLRTLSSTVDLAISSVTKVRAHKGAIRYAALRPGDLISSTFYRHGHQRLSLSIYRYSAPSSSEMTVGSIVRVTSRAIETFHRGMLTVEHDSAASVIESHRLRSVQTLRVGQTAQVFGKTSNGLVHASVIEIFVSHRLPKKITSENSIYGSVSRATSHRVVLQLGGNVDLSLAMTTKSAVFVGSRRIRPAWITAGPSIEVIAGPSPHGPVLREAAFHPQLHTTSGQIVGTSRDSLTIWGRGTEKTKLLTASAQYTDHGRNVHRDDAIPGDYVSTTNFMLLSRARVALAVSVEHPSAHFDCTVASVHDRTLGVVRSSGLKDTIKFPKTGRIVAEPTGQKFRPSQVPIQGALSVYGTYKSGFIAVSQTSMTLKSQDLVGTVSTIINKRAAEVTVDGTSYTVRANNRTIVTIGRDPKDMSAIEVTDTVSVRAYLDATGGLLAATIEIRRPDRTRTGSVSNLATNGFTVVSSTGNTTSIRFDSYTTIEENGQVVPSSDLQDGVKVEVSGHLAPDGDIDATRIKILSTS